MATMFSVVPHLNQLHEVLKILLLVNGELAIVVDDAVVFHLAVAADAQRVIARIVGALPHQEQARLWRVEEPFGLLSSYLAMKPAARREDGQKIRNKTGTGGKKIEEQWRDSVEKEGEREMKREKK